MSYRTFKMRVNALIERIGGGVEVRFSTDFDEGKHYAIFSDVGNRLCKRVEVRWNGKNHCGITAI